MLAPSPEFLRWPICQDIANFSPNKEDMPPQIPYKAGVVRGSMLQSQLRREHHQDPKTGWDKEASWNCSFCQSETTISDVRSPVWERC